MSVSVAQRLEPRNPTEDAILAAARQGLVEDGYDVITMDGIARRAFVSRTAVYFYFPNKRALIDRLIQQSFAAMYEAGAPYLDGGGDPRQELRRAIARVVSVVNRDATLLLVAAHLSGREDALPEEWAPYIRRMVVAAARRIRRDQQRGIAPADISPRIAAQALCAMVERHITVDVVRGGGDANESIRVLAELWWRAVYGRTPG